MLNIDSYYEIIKLLDSSNSTLYSCIQVSKDFAKITIPILYANPWKFEKRLKDQKFWPLFTRTFLSSLPLTHTKLLFSKNVDITKIIQENTLYNYVKHCKFVTTWSISQISYEIFKKCIEKKEHKNETMWPPIYRELYLLFILNSTRIEYFEVPEVDIFDNIMVNINVHEFSLSLLECCSYYKPEVFTSLSNYCRNIQHIIINLYHYDNPGLAQLISEQKSLKSIELKISQFQTSKKYNLLSQALLKPNFLQSIYFEDFICVNLDCLQYLCKNSLKVLKLNLTGSLISLVEFEMLLQIGFEKLEKIDICSNINYDMSYFLKEFIKRTTINLKIIHWNFIFFNETNTQNLVDYIQNIINYCPNVEFLTIWYTTKLKDLDYLKNLVTSCKKLKQINVQLVGYITLENIRKLLEIFFCNFNLRVIEFHAITSFDMKDRYQVLLNDYKTKNGIKIKYYSRIMVY